MGRAMKLISGLAGVAAVAVAVPLLIAGTVLFAWAAGDSRTELPAFDVVTEGGVALTADVDLYVDDQQVLLLPARSELTLQATDDRELFMGIGSEADVAAFLRSGGIPSDQDFWVVADRGADVSVAWEPARGEWSLVVMNADGSPGVDATFVATVPSAPLRVVGGLIGFAGVAAAAIGVTLIVVGWGRSPRGGAGRRTAEAAA